MKLRYVAVGVVAAALALSACSSSKSSGGDSSGSGSGSTTTAANKSPYTIAAVGSFTGAVAGSATSYLNGIKVAVDAANDAGGIDGHPIKLVTLDDGGDAAKGVANTRTAVNVNKAIGICCGVYAAVTTATVPLWQSLGVPGIGSGVPVGTLDTTKGVGGNPPNHFAFVSDLNAGTGEWQQEIAVVKKWAAEDKIDKPKVAIAALATAAGASAASSFTTAAQALGWTIVSSQQVSLDGTNLDAPAAKIVAAKPDYVVGAVASTSEQPFYQGLRQAGYKGKILDYSSGTVSSIFQALNDPDVYGLLAFNYPGGSNAAVTTYQNLMKTAGVDPGAQLTPTGYSGGLMLVAALKKCGDSCTADSLAKGYESLSGFDGGGFFAGPLKMSADNHDAFTLANVVHWQDGAMKVSTSVTGNN